MCKPQYGCFGAKQSQMHANLFETMSAVILADSHSDTSSQSHTWIARIKLSEFNKPCPV